MTTTKKDDFIDLQYTGYTNGEVFDSNVLEELKKASPDTKPRKTIISLGHEMVLNALDKELIGKEIGKEYEVHINSKDAFGPRKRELVKTIPLKVFTAQKVNPQPGATLYLDNMMAKVLTVSGARVITDFNNPLAGKDLDYKFKILRVVTDQKEKAEAFLEYYLRMIPENEIKDNKLILKGPEPLKHFVETFKDKAKEILKMEMDFQLVDMPRKDTPSQ